MAVQTEGLGDNGCEVLQQPSRLLVWKGRQKRWLLSVIAPSGSHTSILKQYVSGRKKSRLSLCLRFRVESTASTGLDWLPGQIPGKGETYLPSLDKGSQGMTESSGHERAVGFRIGPQNCCWVIWNIYAKLKKQKKNATSEIIEPKYRGQGLENERSPQTVPFGQGAVWTMVTWFVLGCSDSVNL